MGSEYINSSSECCDLAVSHMNRKARPLTSERAFYLVGPQGLEPRTNGLGVSGADALSRN